MADEALSGVDSSPVNPDIARERQKASFNPIEITHMIDGGKQITKRRNELENQLFSDPVFCFKDDIYLSTLELYSATMARSVKLFRLKRDQGWSEQDLHLALRIIRDTNCLSLQHAMFVPAIERLATEEQKARWLPLSRSFQMIGTYAQTELGHGTNLMALETTATYNKSSEEFILNTPKLSSIKWWPGSLAHSTNHAIVLAQLVIDNKKYGMHGFMVPTRSMVDHTPMPGIKLGAIGQKMGGNFADNGFLFLNNVRIPRENMLMKNSQVSRTGTFQTSGPDKANYATMIYVRVMICIWSYASLSMSVTAAIRYSSVRRQSSLQPGKEESPVLDYQTQQYKLFPALATSYATFFIHKVLADRYQAMQEDIKHGNFRALPEMHAWSSGLKALLSELCTHNVEVCRRACGGHGYLRAAGISDLLCNSVTLVTVEGENTVLYLQVARYLLKQIAKALTGQRTTGTTEYLNMNSTSYVCPLQKPSDCRNLDFLCDIYQKRAYSMVLQVAQTVQRDMEAGKEQAEYMNNNLQQLVRMAMAHSYCLAMKTCVEGLRSVDVSVQTNRILQKLCCLFGVHHIVKMSGDFLELEAIGLEQLRWLQNLELQLLAEIRPDAVTLVDAFDWHDETLASAIGCYDGRAYERLYEAALKEPQNQNEVDPSYEKYLRQLILEGAKSKL